MKRSTFSITFSSFLSLSFDVFCLPSFVILFLEDDDEDDEETCSEDETSKTMYTAISNTPTRITLLSNTSQQSMQGTLKNKNRRGSKVPKKKVSITF